MHVSEELCSKLCAEDRCRPVRGQALRMAVLLLSLHPLLDQCLLHLHPTHLTDLPTDLPPPQLLTVLTKGAVRGVPLCWFPQ